MSLLSPESLSVFIGPNALVAVHWRGLRAQVVHKRLCQVAALPGAAWAGAATAFADLLKEFATCQQVRVVLSSHFTAYQLLPWRDDLDDAQEEQAFAQLAFAQTYGEVAATWQVRLSDASPGQPKVAVGVDSALLTALVKGAEACKTRLVSIQPYFVAAVNHWRKQLAHSGTSWVVLHEDGRLCIGLVEAGHWQWLRSVRIDSDWLQGLPDLLDHEMLLAGRENLAKKVLIYSPTKPDTALPASGHWTFQRLTLPAQRNFSPVTDGHFGLALLGQ